MISTEGKWTKEYLNVLNHNYKDASPDIILQWAVKNFGQKAVMGTGFGSSGILLLHQIYLNNLGIPVFYIDTDLLFGETYKLKRRLEERFEIPFKRVATDVSLEEQEDEYLPELWRNNPNKCCLIRKVLPLKSYLSDKKAWITGVRKQQAESRNQTKIFEWDPLNEVLKINPLAEWTSREVWDYLKINELPYNPLHDHGFPSIGCVPCTDEVKPGEHERAGRWRQKEKVECGIHVSAQANSG